MACRRINTHTRQGGFSLTELMIAIGIFAIGAISVASIFPVAIMLQKQTMSDTKARAFAESAQAMALARGFAETPLTALPMPDQTVTAVPAAYDAAAGSDWELEDRSYRSGIDLVNRRYFWVPLFFDNNPGTEREWIVFLFVVKAKTDATYDKTTGTWANPNDPKDAPGSVAVPGVGMISNATVNTTSGVRDRFDFTNVDVTGNYRLIRIGDKILDEKGRDWIVKGADALGVQITGIIPDATGTLLDVWYADPGDSGTSSYVGLYTLRNNASSNRLIVP